jgi:hypothetical protein
MLLLAHCICLEGYFIGSREVKAENSSIIKLADFPIGLMEQSIPVALLL